MGWFLLANVGIPLLFVIPLLIFERAATRVPPGWEQCTDIALTLAIFSLGATGQVFGNPKLAAAFGPNIVLLGIAVVCLNLIFASILVYRKSRLDVDQVEDPGPRHGLASLSVGVLSISVTWGILVLGYRVAEKVQK
jgi:hypothetical protein